MKPHPSPLLTSDSRLRTPPFRLHLRFRWGYVACSRKERVSIAPGRTGLATTRCLASLFCDVTLHIRAHFGSVSLKCHPIVV